MAAPESDREEGNASRSMSEDSAHEIEADRLALYLVGQPAGAREKRIYAEAMRKVAIALNPRERALWQRMLRSRFCLACADGGLALLKPTSPLRRRVFMMLAILEASPAYTDYFLAREFSRFYLLKVGWAAARGAARGLLGIVIVKAAGI